MNFIFKQTFSAALMFMGLILGALNLQGCTSVRTADGVEMSIEQSVFITGGKDYFPGGTMFHSFGSFQNKDYFANIKHLHHEYSFFRDRSWQRVLSADGVANMGALTAYQPLHVRWELKDGRQFMLENINIREIMREYFRKNKVPLEYEIQKRPSHWSDSEGALAYEVKENTLLVKWMVRINQLPIEDRQTQLWRSSYQTFPVITLTAPTTSGQIFSEYFIPAKR